VSPPDRILGKTLQRDTRRACGASPGVLILDPRENMSDPAPPTASDRLRAISHDLKRLAYSSRNPERYHELKSDLVGRIEKLARDLEVAERLVRELVAAKKKLPVRTGTVTKPGRSIPVTKRAPRALQKTSDNRPSRT
jgi:hypothetical protein